MRRLAATVSMLALASVPAAHASVVTVTYSAEAFTVTNPAPFGLASIPLGTVVSGYFTFDTAAADDDPSPLLGEYQQSGNAAFAADFLSTRIRGSNTPFYEIQLDQSGQHDTFRIYDGPSAAGPEGGVMSLDGTPDDDIQLFVAITEDVFDDDALIDPFPLYDFGFLGTTHTFSLEDDEGTMLLQLTGVAEAVCGDANGSGISAGDALQVLRTSVGSRECLPCICDVDHSGTITTTDALRTLRFSVSATPPLACAACL
jgi:hypothetical protein